MSELTFTCTKCGRSIVADTSRTGTPRNCPDCQTTFIIPNVSAPSQSERPRMSGLAVASFICSLSSIITCIGWLPGILCGHLAKSAMRRDPNLKGSGLATAGLVMGYVGLVLTILSIFILLRDQMDEVKPAPTTTASQFKQAFPVSQRSPT